MNCDQLATELEGCMVVAQSSTRSIRMEEDGMSRAFKGYILKKKKKKKKEGVQSTTHQDLLSPRIDRFPHWILW